MTTYTARIIFPVSTPPLSRGTITIDNATIVAVEPHGVRTPDVDLGNVAIIPGLVNAHTHLDLSGARGLIPPTDPEHFTDWLMGVIAYRKTRTTEQVQDDIGTGLAECMNFGTTLIGDISADGASWYRVASSSLRGVIYREVIGVNSSRLVERLVDHLDWMLSLPKREFCRPGLSPHAPYSVHRTGFRGLKKTNIPSAIHLAESPGEIELLTMKQGPFVPFLQAMNVYDAEAVADSPEEVIHTMRYLHNVLLIHCNYLNGDEVIHKNQTIVFCPRTHAAFKHPHHPFPLFLARGVRVALGTDSLASNPDLDLLAEARAVKERYPEVTGEQILTMATLAGAEALGWADTCGSLEAGKSADFVLVPLPDAEHEDPYELLLGKDASDGPRRTQFRGWWRD